MQSITLPTYPFLFAVRPIEGTVYKPTHIGFARPTLVRMTEWEKQVQSHRESLLAATGQDPGPPDAGVICQLKKLFKSVFSRRSHKDGTTLPEDRLRSGFFTSTVRRRHCDYPSGNESLEREISEETFYTAFDDSSDTWQTDTETVDSEDFLDAQESSSDPPTPCPARTQNETASSPLSIKEEDDADSVSVTSEDLPDISIPRLRPLPSSTLNKAGVDDISELGEVAGQLSPLNKDAAKKSSIPIEPTPIQLVLDPEAFEPLTPWEADPETPRTPTHILKDILPTVANAAVHGDAVCVKLILNLYAEIGKTFNGRRSRRSRWTPYERSIIRKAYLLLLIDSAVQRGELSLAIFEVIRMQLLPSEDEVTMEYEVFNSYIHIAMQYNELSQTRGQQILLLATNFGQDDESDQDRDLELYEGVISRDEIAAAAENTPNFRAHAQECVVGIENYLRGDARPGARGTPGVSTPHRFMFTPRFRGSKNSSGKQESLVQKLGRSVLRKKKDKMSSQSLERA